MKFPEMVETAVMRFSDSSEEAPPAAHHLRSKGLVSGTKALERVSEQQEYEQTTDKESRPWHQQVDQYIAQWKTPYTASTTTKPSPHRNQFLLPSEMGNTPVFRRSATPMPAQESYPDTFPGRIRRTPSIPRSNAPSLSDRSVTVRSRSRDQRDSFVQPGKTPRNSDLNDDEKSLAQFELSGTSCILSNCPEEKHLPSIRSPSWSPLTTPPESPLVPMTDIIDKDVDCRRTSPLPTSPIGRQPSNQTFDSEMALQQKRLDSRPPRTPSPQRPSKPKTRNPRSRVKGQGGRVHANGVRRQAASTRWSPVIPWSPNRKAVFHYDVQQRLAAATRGTHVDNGLFEVPLEYFDI
ncbi:hypothetical protein LX36DRAFT_231358 [Colletotrichum falcatum]|nr:hypothetical protein LX36DRAFT_231358 [Colletotrichum falcatum]